MKNPKVLACGILLGITPSANAAGAQILGWNNLGMHCMDSDYSVFSILPPYNTIEAQLIVGGKLVKAGTGYSVTYQAVADPANSFNSTAMGKGNFYTYAKALYGATLPAEGGLKGWSMPGPANTPQAMLFETANEPVPTLFTPVNWWRAEGIPISPYDDAHHKNPYPMMRIIARNGGGTVIAQNDVVLPVSDEMDCRACHASGTQDAAMPDAGWVWDGEQERDFRLNILRLHDEHEFARDSVHYGAALANGGFNAQGLYRGVVADGKPVLCAACHASEALGAPSFPGVPQLTTSVHAYHAHVRDPVLNTRLDDYNNRAACYRCHPGSTTKCLRGAMGGAIASDGSMEMQCQSCHGNMSAVGSGRTGWFDEPNCQSCHTGTATANMGQIRFTSAIDPNTGNQRVPSNWDPLNPPAGLNTTFATTPNTPATGLSLYRFGYGHGGLQCSACHGSTHAEFPSTHANDNVRNIAIQGHAGTMIECTSCHTSMPTTVSGGPHGMHPVDNNWALNHGGMFEGSPPSATRAQCQACHGLDFKGTVLSRVQATTRSLNTKFGARTYLRGRTVSCYDCHDGAYSSDPTTHSPAVAQTPPPATTECGTLVSIPLTATGTGTLTWRVVSQPANGTVSVNNTNRTAGYLPNLGFVGTDSFTLAVNNTWVDSNIVTATVTVAQGEFSIAVSAQVPPSYPAGWSVALAAVPNLTNLNATPSFDWNFGDGTAHGTSQFPTHTYAAAGSYNWSVTASVPGASATATGTIVIDPPVAVGVSPGSNGNTVTLAWPVSTADTLLQTSTDLGLTSPWQWVPIPPITSGGMLRVTVPNNGRQFFRVVRPW